MKLQKLLVLGLPFLMACSHLKPITFEQVQTIVTAIRDKYQSFNNVELDIEITYRSSNNKDYLEQQSFDSKNKRYYHYTKNGNVISQQWEYFTDDVLWVLESNNNAGQIIKVRYKKSEQPAQKGLDYFRYKFHGIIWSDVSKIDEIITKPGKTKENYQGDGASHAIINVENSEQKLVSEINNSRLLKVNYDNKSHIYDYALFVAEVRPEDFPIIPEVSCHESN